MENNPHNLQRFLDAQSHAYPQALSELKRGKKESHWIWFIFPQVQGLGTSYTAEHYAIKSSAEAVAYLAHETLGARLLECTRAILAHDGKDIGAIMGFPDYLKLQSCMTLFDTISPGENPFTEVLDAFYEGELDEKTIRFLQES